MNTELIHLICAALEIREKKADMIKVQKYQNAAALRDKEKALIYKVGELMFKLDLTNKSLIGLNTNNIEDIINNYLESNYGVSYKGEHTAKSLRRQLKLEEIFKKD
jgi:hypothetical protein